MKRTMRSCAALLAALLFGGWAAGMAQAHGDEDHGAEKPAGAAPAETLETAAARRLPDGSLFVPKPVQRRLGLRHVIVKMEDLAATIELNGKVIADPNAGGRVQATQAGRVEAAAKGMPTLGQQVSKGQVLAYLHPVASSLERGNQQAQLAELEAQLAIAEKKRARYDELEGAVAQSAIEAARLEAQALRKRRAAVAMSLGAPEPLVAPVSGVVGAASVVAGQVVEAREILFEVIDPARLAVEALAYDAALAEGIAGASAPLPGGALELTFVGGGRQLREQALPLLFRVKSANAPVAVGQPLKVIAQTVRSVRGAAVPLAAIVKVSPGETAVWVRDGAERFVLRKVGVAPLDAGRVAAVKGLEDGERVVSEGAGLLTQVR